MSRPCPACTAPISDAGAICHPCDARLRQTCAELPELHRQLDITATRTSGSSGHGSGAGGLPYDPVAADLRDRLRASCASWCVLLHEDMGVDFPHDTIDDMCNTIATSEIRMHDAAPEALAELGDLRRAALKAIDWPEDRTVTPVAPCPQGGDGWQCEGIVFVHYPTDGAEPTLRCHSCPSQWTVADWVKWQAGGILLPPDDQWLTVADLTTATGLAPATIRTTASIEGWRRERRAGHAYYHPDDVNAWLNSRAG